MSYQYTVSRRRQEMKITTILWGSINYRIHRIFASFKEWVHTYDLPHIRHQVRISISYQPISYIGWTNLGLFLLSQEYIRWINKLTYVFIFHYQKLYSHSHPRHTRLPLKTINGSVKSFRFVKWQVCCGKAQPIPSPRSSLAEFSLIITLEQPPFLVNIYLVWLGL